MWGGERGGVGRGCVAWSITDGLCYILVCANCRTHRTVWSVDGRRAGWGTGAATTVQWRAARHLATGLRVIVILVLIRCM